MDRISVVQNRLTGRWRVKLGDRTAYYCETWREAHDRAEELAEKRREQRDELLTDLNRERWGSP